MGDRFVGNSAAPASSSAARTKVQVEERPRETDHHDSTAGEESRPTPTATATAMPPQQEDRRAFAAEGPAGGEGGGVNVNVNDLGRPGEVWIARGGGGGGGGGGSTSPPITGGVSVVDVGGEPGGGAGAGAGGAREEVDSLTAATARLHLGDGDGEGGGEMGSRGDVGGEHREGGGQHRSPVGDDGQQWQEDESEREREREPQPKFGLKVLVPGITAGCLIGKGGKIITQLQTATGTRVKLSQKNEFFPGTHDRVALVQGEDPNMVADAVAEMLRRLREAARPNPHDGFGGLGGGGLDGPHGRNAQVTIRLLVPLAAGGLIIGRGGETIKAIGARTGARVILAGKDADVAGVPSERLCSIQADLEGAIKVMRLIVGKMAEDRGLSKYQSNQTCYQTGLSSPGMGGDGSMDGSQHPHPQLHPLHLGNSANPAFMQQPQASWGAGGRGGGNPNPGFGGGGPLPGPQQGQQGAQQGPAMGVARGPGNESGVGPAGLGAMPSGGSASQGQLMGGAFPSTAAPGAAQPGAGGAMGMQQQQQQQQQQAALAAGRAGMMAAGGMIIGYPYPGVQHQGFAQGNMAMGGMPPMYPSFGTDMSILPSGPGPHQGPVAVPELMDPDVVTQAQVAVPDHMVGVILGKGGATVIDMQNQTGARIQVSQRGDYVPGTQNRPVTISGTPQAVAHAQAMVHNVCSQAAQSEVRQIPQPGMQQQQQQQQQQQPQQYQQHPQHQQQHVPPFY